MPGWLFGTTSDYARFDAAPPVTAAPLTMMYCGQLSSLTANCVGMIICNSARNDRDFRLTINNVGNNLSFNVSQGTNTSATTVNTATVGTTYTAIGREISTTQHESILNGDLANKGTSSTSKVPTTLSRLTFGKKDDSGNTAPFTGTIFYGALWNVALDDGEVTALAAGFDPRLIRPSALVGYWDDFSTGATGAIRDLRGAVPLTVTGGSASTVTSPRRIFPQSGRVVSLPFMDLVGTAAGVASSSADLTALGMLAGTAAGTSTAFGALTEAEQPPAQQISTSRGAPVFERQRFPGYRAVEIAGIARGHSSAYGRLSGVANLSGRGSHRRRQYRGMGEMTAVGQMRAWTMGAATSRAHLGADRAHRDLEAMTLIVHELMGRL